MENATNAVDKRKILQEWKAFASDCERGAGPRAERRNLDRARVALQKGRSRKAAVTPEPFVSAEEAARFLSIKRRYLLTLARRGIAGAYALGTGTMRRVWVFRLSEVATAIANRTTLIQKSEKYGTIRSGNLHAGKRTA